MSSGPLRWVGFWIGYKIDPTRKVLSARFYVAICQYGAWKLLWNLTIDKLRRRIVQQMIKKKVRAKRCVSQKYLISSWNVLLKWLRVHGIQAFVREFLRWAKKPTCYLLMMPKRWKKGRERFKTAILVSIREMLKLKLKQSQFLLRALNDKRGTHLDLGYCILYGQNFYSQKEFFLNQILFVFEKSNTYVIMWFNRKVKISSLMTHKFVRIAQELIGIIPTGVLGCWAQWSKVWHKSKTPKFNQAH